MTGEKLKQAIVKKYGTVAKFAILTEEDYGKIMRAIYKDDTALLEKLYEDTPVKAIDREMNSDLLNQIKEAIKARGGATKFVKDSGYYSKSTIDDILSGNRTFITKKIKELLYDLGIWEKENTSL